MWWMGYQSKRNDLQNAIKALWGLILTPFDIYFDIWIFRYLDKYSYLNGFIISYSIFLYFSFGYILEECAKCNKGTMGLNSKPSLPPFDIYLDTIPYHILTQYLTTQNVFYWEKMCFFGGSTISWFLDQFVTHYISNYYANLKVDILNLTDADF